MKPMLAHKYENQDPSGWWMSEKYDGIRAIWNGKEFLSRTGKLFQAPDWFKEGLPNFTLDGELWCGRGRFQETVGIVRSHLGNSDWKGVQYLIFDMYSNLEFEERQKMLNTFDFPDHIFLVEYSVCGGKEMLIGFKEHILNCQGEGVMLRAPHSMYEERRSHNLLKVKDMKHSVATVLGYTDGKGKYEGMIGALRCLWANNDEEYIIHVGSGLDDADRHNPPPIGCCVKLKYFDVTEAGMPRFPIYEGVV